MGILDLVFGQKQIRHDDFFGKIESARTRKKDSKKSLSWNFEMKIGEFKKETYIILEGNFMGIDPIQKTELKKFIENFETTYSSEIDKLIQSDNKCTRFKNWRNEYYLAFICPIFESNTNFEICFEAIDEEKSDDYFNLDLISGMLKISEI